MLLYNRKGRLTGEKLAAALQIPHGNQLIDPDTTDFLIRWGNSFEEEADEHFEKVLNKSEAIQNATNKLRSFELMMEAGLEVPAFSTDPRELLETVGYPILGRNFSGSKGRDIKLCLQERDFRRQKDFYTAYIPTKREFRIHVVGEKVVRVQGKYLDFPEKQKAHIRNYDTGYRFRNPRLRLRPERLQAAITAVSILGLDFGAVDLILGDDNRTYILEVNTAPSCSPLTGAKYVTGIAEMLHDYELEIDLEHLNLLDPDEENQDEMEEEDGEADL